MKAFLIFLGHFLNFFGQKKVFSSLYCTMRSEHTLQWRILAKARGLIRDLLSVSSKSTGIPQAFLWNPSGTPVEIRMQESLGDWIHDAGILHSYWEAYQKILSTVWSFSCTFLNFIIFGAAIWNFICKIILLHTFWHHTSMKLFVRILLLKLWATIKNPNVLFCFPVCTLTQSLNQ